MSPINSATDAWKAFIKLIGGDGGASPSVSGGSSGGVGGRGSLIGGGGTHILGGNYGLHGAQVGPTTGVWTPPGGGPLNVTHFGYPSDPTWDSASGRGQGAWVPHMESGYDVALNAQGRAIVGNPHHGATFMYKGKEYRNGDQIPPWYKDPRMDMYDPFYGPPHPGRGRYSAPHNKPNFHGGPLTPEEKAQLGKTEVTINHTVHYHVSDGVEGGQLAQAHSRHMSKLKKDLEEAEWRSKRNSMYADGTAYG
jgi:hypothetical protein